MSRLFGCLLVAILCSVLVSCTRRPPEDFRINDIVRVFWHEGSRYSVHVQPDGTNEIDVRQYSINCPSTVGDKQIWKKVRLISDVPQGQKMWLVGRRLKSDNCISEIEIHLHHAQSVEGGGWNHGKFGRGQTHVME